MKYDFNLDLHSDNSLSLIVRRIKFGSTVLEFGPANGRLTRHLKENLGCKVYAVEIDPEAAEDVLPYAQGLVVGNIETYGWVEQFGHLNFDAVVFADVLEHLLDPQKAMEWASKLLAQKGVVLISMPNVAHNAIVLELLDDRFTYRPTGLLDNTHVRFFTKKSLEELLEACNLCISYECATYVTPNQSEFEREYGWCRMALQGRDFGEVYQFIVEAKKGDCTTQQEFLSPHIPTLYLDNGEGFNAQKTLIAKSQLAQLDHTFTLPKGEKFKALRYDPAEVPVALILGEVCVDGKKVQEINHNGVEQYEKILFFHGDPQIYIPLNGFASTVEIRLDKLEVLGSDTAILGLHRLLEAQKRENVLNAGHIEELAKERDSLLESLKEARNHTRALESQMVYWRELAHSMRLVNRIRRLAKPVTYWLVLKRVGKLILPVRGLGLLRYLRTNRHLLLLLPTYLNQHWLKGTWHRMHQKVHTQALYTYTPPFFDNKAKNEMASWRSLPLVSVIMPVYNVDPKWLNLAIGSLEAQWYEHWELCMVDDASPNSKTKLFLRQLEHPKIRVKFLEHSQNICGTSNEALAMTRGEYVALMDNDDELTPDALFEVVKAINATGAEFIYSDEDKLEMDGTFSDPHFKPDFSPDLLLSQNYMSHLGVIKWDLAKKVGGFAVGREGSQDYDLYLKVLEHTRKVTHIPKVLYHWRKIPGSTAAMFNEKSYAQEAGRVALEQAMKRRRIKAIAENGPYPGTYRVRYTLIGTPLISIIIPFKDKPELLGICVGSILQKSTYPNFEIIGVSNNSQDTQTLALMRKLEEGDQRVRFVENNMPFNYAAINNHVVAYHISGDILVLLNNDTEVITPSWLEAMLEHAQRKEIGCVGALLYYPNDTIQHAGIILGIGGVAGHSHKYYARNANGYFSRLKIVQNVSAVTAACLMVRKEVYTQAGGLNEEDLAIAFNDVDFCLRVQEMGYRNLYTPYAQFYHYESMSRGLENTPEKQARFQKEVAYMRQRHRKILEEGDPHYNPNLTLDREDYSVRCD